jgi:hypothetical protein
MDDYNLDENHLVSDINCNTANLYPKKLQGMINSVEVTLSVGDTPPRLQLELVSSKRIRIGDNKYHNQCNFMCTN